MSRPPIRDRLAATTWWSLGVSLAIGASLTRRLDLLVALCVVSLTLTAFLSRPDIRKRVLPIYLSLAFFVVIVRVVFRIVFNQPSSDTSVFVLPWISVRIFETTITLLGPVSARGLEYAVIDGLRLAGIILGIAMATSLAEPRKLLRATPAALYEVATATVVAVNLAPQLLSSLQRVRLARKFRGLDTKWWRFGSLLVPVLEDTIERSLKLAASMDSRGFGRIGAVPRRVLVGFQLLSLLSLCFLASATFLILATDQQVWISLVLVSLGLCSLALSLRLAGLAKLRTKYPGKPLGYADFLILACCVLGLLVLANATPGNEGLLQWNP